MGAAGSEDLKSHFGSRPPVTEVTCSCSPNCFLETIVGVTCRGADVGSHGAAARSLSFGIQRLSSTSLTAWNQKSRNKVGCRVPGLLPDLGLAELSEFFAS